MSLRHDAKVQSAADLGGIIQIGTDDICVDPAVEHGDIVAVSQSRSLCCFGRSISLDGGVSKFSDDHPDGSAGFPVLALQASR